MLYFHGARKQHSYFEGWYLKHQKGEHMLAVIPSYHIDTHGRRYAMIQIITEQGSDSVVFPAHRFHADEKEFAVRVGPNYVSKQGICLHLETERFSVHGNLTYRHPVQPPWNMMGPFQVLSHMQCNHGVISLAHRLEGCLQINGEWLSMDGGFGYVETDWGSSFPDGYLWTQANFVDHGPSSVMLSVAEIPILNTRFTGSIAAILHRGKCYRLATYSGASLLRCSAEQTILKQGGLSLQVTCLAQTPHLLYAPSSGDMNRLIRESPSCPVRYRFRQGEHLLFDRVCQHASFERVPKQKKAQSL